jgi:hypothetical protein
LIAIAKHLRVSASRSRALRDARSVAHARTLPRVAGARAARRGSARESA